MIKTLALAGAAAVLVVGSMAVAQTTAQNPNAASSQNGSQNGYNAPSATQNGSPASATAPNGTAPSRTAGERG